MNDDFFLKKKRKLISRLNDEKGKKMDGRKNKNEWRKEENFWIYWMVNSQKERKKTILGQIEWKRIRIKVKKRKKKTKNFQKW